MRHLTEPDCHELLSDGLPDAQREAFEAHVDACADCQALLERVMETGEPAVLAPATRQLDEARHILLRAFVSRAPERARLMRSKAPIIAQLAATPPGALELDLLAWLGSTTSFTERALALRTDEAALEAAVQDLGEHLRARHAALLERAEAAARSLCGEAFERFAARREREAREPEAEEGAIAAPLRHAAAGAHWIGQYPCHEDPDYSLYVEQVDEGGKRTNIRCLGPGKKRRFRYRLWFESADEENALGARRLGPEERGVLRVAYAMGRGRWTELLDLLLPWRFGTDRDDADPAFREVVRRGSVEGWLVGIPTRGRLWLLD